MLIYPEVSLLANDAIARKWHCESCGTTWTGSIEQQLDREDPQHGPDCVKRTVASDLTEWVEYWSEGNPPADTVSFRTTKEYLWNLPNGEIISRSPNEVASGGLWHGFSFRNVQSSGIWNTLKNMSSSVVSFHVQC